MGQINVVRRFRFIFQIGTVALIVVERLSPLTLQPEQAKTEDKQRANQTKPRGSPGVSAKEAGGDNVLDLRRAWQSTAGRSTAETLSP